FGYALTLDVDHVPLAVWDQSGTPASRDLISRFAGSPYFDIVRHVDNERDMNGALDSGDALMALVIPYDFGRKIASQAEAPLQMVLSGVDSNTATIALGYADAIADIYAQDWSLQRMKRLGATDYRFPLNISQRVWFNEDLESRNYIVPG